MSTIKLKGSSSGEAAVTVAAAAGTPTFILPTTVGSAGQVLQNSSTPGTLEFANAGKILQVKQVVKSDTTSVGTTNGGATAPAAISGLVESITMTSSSNKVLILVSLNLARQPQGVIITAGLTRGGTDIAANTGGNDDGFVQSYVGGAEASMMVAPMIHLDTSPGAGTHTYQVTWRVDSHVGYLNRYHGSDSYKSQSSITLLEVAA